MDDERELLPIPPSIVGCSLKGCTEYLYVTMQDGVAAVEAEWILLMIQPLAGECVTGPFLMSNIDIMHCIKHTVTMRITLSLPDGLAKQFLAVIPNRERSATVARLLEQELKLCQQALETACLAANADKALEAECAEWQAFHDDESF